MDYENHEILHLTWVLSDMWERHIAGDDYVLRNPELLAQANVISDLLGDFYQLVGRQPR